MNEVHITWLQKICSSAAQIYSWGLEYALVSEDMQQCHPFVYCKDFLHDAIYALVHNTKVNVHGFCYTGNPPAYLGETRLLLAHRSIDNFPRRIMASLQLLNLIEKQFRSYGSHGKHLALTRCFCVANPPPRYGDVFLLQGSKVWLESPPMLSLYSLLVRVGLHFQPGLDLAKLAIALAVPVNERMQLSQAKSGIDRILKNGYRQIFYRESVRNYPKVDAHELHHNFGIVGFSRGWPKNAVPHWYRSRRKSC